MSTKDLPPFMLISCDSADPAPVFEAQHCISTSTDSRVLLCRKEKDPRKPKKPTSAYFVFCNERRPKMLADSLKIPEVRPSGRGSLFLTQLSCYSIQLRDLRTLFSVSRLVGAWVKNGKLWMRKVGRNMKRCILSSHRCRLCCLLPSVSADSKVFCLFFPDSCGR